MATQQVQEDEVDALLGSKDELRRRAAEAYMSVGKQARGMDASLTQYGMQAADTAEQQGQSAIARGSAQALASTQGGGGFGRAGLAGASQIGADAGFARGQLATDIAKQRLGVQEASAQRRADASAADIQGFEALGNMGTNAEDEAAQRADIDARINAIVKANKGFFNDDEETMASQIRNLITPNMSAANQAYIAQRMNAIRSQSEDV